MIILNEHEYAQKILNDPQMGKKPFDTLTKIARYYLDQGYNKNDTRKKLDYFVLQCDPTISLVKMDNMLDNALKKALKKEAVIIDHVDITRPELEIIDSLNGKMIKRLAFTLLCVAKYWNIVKGSDYWTSNEDNEIMTMANIKTSIKRQDELYRELRNRGLITFSRKVDNTNVRVDFVEDGEVVLQINDFRNLGYQYMRYAGGNFYECQNCGIICKNNNKDGRGRRPKYCDSCAHDIHMKQMIDAVMRSRKSKARAQ